MHFAKGAPPHFSHEKAALGEGGSFHPMLFLFAEQPLHEGRQFLILRAFGRVIVLGSLRHGMLRLLRICRPVLRIGLRARIRRIVQILLGLRLRAVVRILRLTGLIPVERAAGRCC